MPRDCVALAAADLKWLLAAYPDENPEVAYWIGYCHYCGTGGVGEINHNTAVLHFQKAANRNHGKALWRLAECYHWGWGVSENETRETQLFQEANAALRSELQKDRNNDDAEAQYLLGLSYYWGFGGLNQDDARAFSLYQQAAQQGHVVGQRNVSNRLKFGNGVTKDCVQAAGWYGQAARQGHSTARDELGNLFAEEAGLKEQLAAVAWSGALDQQETFLAASALAYFWTQTNGATSITAQQWQDIVDQCTNKVPPSWKSRILENATNRRRAEDERKRQEEEETERRRQEEEERRRREEAAERLRREAAGEERRRRNEELRRRKEEQRRRREEAAERLERRQEHSRREHEDQKRSEAPNRHGQREESKAPLAAIVWSTTKSWSLVAWGMLQSAVGLLYRLYYAIRNEAPDRHATNPLSKLQNIQNNNDVPVRQAQLAALVKELQVCWSRRSANKPEVFRVLGYCFDHGIGMEQEDQEQAFRLYVKADELVGIKPGAARKKQGWFSCGRKAVSSAEWLYHRLEDERVTCYQTRFALDVALERLSAAATRGEKARDSAIIRQAIRCEFELTFLQGLLRMDRFTTEAELREKADNLTKQADRSKNKAERLPLIEEWELVKAQLKNEVGAREEHERWRHASASHQPPLPPSAPIEEDLQSDAPVPMSPPRSLQ